MTTFRGTVQGDEGGVASRLGRRTVETHADGWEVGVRVVGKEDDGHVVFEIYATRGSGGGSGRYIGCVRLEDGVPTLYPLTYA